MHITIAIAIQLLLLSVLVSAYNTSYCYSITVTIIKCVMNHNLLQLSESNYMIKGHVF